MAGVLKTATGLTGLPVSHTPHKTLIVLYDKILRTLLKIPEDAAYRKYTEETIKEKLAFVKAEPDPIKLEQKMNSGQIEEVIRQAQRELSLARNMVVWRAWEPLVEEAPPNQWKWPI